MHLDQIKIPPPHLPHSIAWKGSSCRKEFYTRVLTALRKRGIKLIFLLSELNFSCIKGTDGVGGGLTHSEPLPS